MQSLYDILEQWNKTHDSLAKLQSVYGVLTVAVFLLAGVVGLVNASLGQSILFFAVLLGLTFIANGVVWALIRTFVVPRAEKTPSSKPAATRKK